ncbi:hypothetical protein DFH28DRAFT_1130356 [Melampsora americana]|nr:hypothetical protein DFH28DRAFT_1130356 [Melampsora americana]
MRQRIIHNISFIAIVLSLSLINFAISLKNDIDIQPEELDTRWRAESSGSSDVWHVMKLSSLFNEVSNIRNTYADERISLEAQMSAHLFQQGSHRSRRSRRRFVKRSPALEGLLNGGREIGEVAQGSKAAETISDINKAREASTTSEGLNNADIAKYGKADSFRGRTTRLDPVPAQFIIILSSKIEVTRSSSLDSTLPKAFDLKSTLKLMDTRFDKSLYGMTDDIFKSELKTDPESEFVEYDEYEKIYQRTRQRPLTFEAFLSLYAEKELFQTIIDGKTDLKTVNGLADILEKRRGIYVNELKQAIKEGVEVKTFLNYNSVQRVHGEVISLRKLIKAPEIKPSELKNAITPPKGVSFPETLAEDEARGKNTDILFQKPLMDLTADEYFAALYKPESSIEIFPAKDASVEKVKGLANEAMEADYIFDTEKTQESYKASRASRKQFQYYLQSYIKNNQPNVNYGLFTDLQEIFNEKGIPLGLKTPPKSKVLVWYDQFKASYQAVMYRLTSIFKGTDSKVLPIPSSSVDPLSIV